MLPSVDDYLHAKNQSYWLIPPNRGPTGHAQPKVIVPDATFPWWLTTYRKTNVSVDSFRTYWWSNNAAIWLDEKQTYPHPTKRSSFRCYLDLMTISMQKVKVIDWFLPVILMIKLSCILIGQETQLATLNQD